MSFRVIANYYSDMSTSSASHNHNNVDTFLFDDGGSIRTIRRTPSRSLSMQTPSPPGSGSDDRDLRETCTALMDGSLPISLPPAQEFFPFIDPKVYDPITNSLEHHYHYEDHPARPSYYIYLAAIARPTITVERISAAGSFTPSKSERRYLFQWAMWIERDPVEYDFPAKRDKRRLGWIYRCQEEVSGSYFRWIKDFGPVPLTPKQTDIVGMTLIGRFDGDTISPEHISRVLYSIDPPRKGASGTETAEYYTWATHALTCLRAIGATSFPSTPVHVIMDWAEDRALMEWYGPWRKDGTMTKVMNRWTYIKIPESGMPEPSDWRGRAAEQLEEVFRQCADRAGEDIQPVTLEQAEEEAKQRDAEKMRKKARRALSTTESIRYMFGGDSEK